GREGRGRWAPRLARKSATRLKPDGRHRESCSCQSCSGQRGRSTARTGQRHTAQCSGSSGAGPGAPGQRSLVVIPLPASTSWHVLDRPDADRPQTAAETPEGPAAVCRAGPSGGEIRLVGVVLLAGGPGEAGGLRGLGGGEPHLGLGLVVEPGAGLVVEHRVLVALDREALGLRAVRQRLVAARPVRRVLVLGGRLLGRLGTLGGGTLGGRGLRGGCPRRDPCRRPPSP